jgi:nitrite reductase/ring-hydroxylating ferredoxin subunit
VAFYPLEKIYRLHDGYRKSIQVAGRQLLLIEDAGQRYLLENSCPHAGYPLLEATLTDGNLRCPLHGICFNLKSGSATNLENASADMKLVFFKLIYYENIIGVEL